MARTLDEKDIALLMKLAPELEDIVCEHAQVPFKSILPPLSNHIAPDVKDFERRVRTLTDKELAYLVDIYDAGRVGKFVMHASGTCGGVYFARCQANFKRDRREANDGLSRNGLL